MDAGAPPDLTHGALDERTAQRCAERCSAVAANVGAVIKGKPEVIELALVCLLAEGHLLVEDVPGTGKTMLARALAASVDARWQRVQFTPDLLPSDVTGVTIWHQGSGAFEFHPGPVFANIVLADEINRASPRTQAALLEVMEERQVSVDGVTHPVPRPFLVIATQNPVDMDGTYPLPEAQLDRFLLRAEMGYPDPASEMAILRGQDGVAPIDRLHPVLALDEAAALTRAVHRVHAGDAVCDYLLRIVAATRTSPEVRLPVSPRGSVSLLRAARARALVEGRPFVTPDDVRTLAGPVLGHRVVLAPEVAVGGQVARVVLDRIVASVPVPQGSGG